MGFSNKRVPCPKCRLDGRDSKGDHLHLYDDGLGGWCSSGHKYVKLDTPNELGDTAVNSNSHYTAKDPSLQISVVNTYPIVGYPERGISKETMEFFGVRTGVSLENGEPSEHWYPYFSTDGATTLSGYKCRILPKDFSRGVTGKIDQLFGQHLCYSNRFLIVVEGEQDCLAGRDMMMKLKGKAYNIVSLPNGANENGSIDLTTKKQFEWMSKFEKIILALDNDTPGKATANALADYLCSHVQVFIAQLPGKDTASMWEAGKEQEWWNALQSAKLYVSDQIVLGSDTPLEELMVPLQSGIGFPFLPRTCDKLHGFRTRELTTVIAPPKCGKSSMLRQMQHHLLISSDDERVGGFFLEETTNKTKQSILALHAGVALNRFRANPSCADKHLIQEANDTLLPRLHLFTHKGKTISDDLLERKIEYMVKGLGCSTVILDHATFVVGTRSSKDERRDIDQMLTRLARMVEDENFRLFLVAHIKRGFREQGRQDKKEKYPYWDTISSDSARGSGAFEQLSHNMLAIEKQVLDPELEESRGLLRTRVLLSREWGVEGIGDYLTFGEDGKFQPVQPTY